MACDPSTAAAGAEADDDDHGTVTAETPLLANHTGQNGPTDEPAVDGPGNLYKQNVIVLCLALALLASLGSGLLQPPTNALLEDIICRQHYPDAVGGFLSHDKLCRNPDVQGRLASIRGWASTFDAIPGSSHADPFSAA